jgi:BRCT domain type II-containing protein
VADKKVANNKVASKNAAKPKAAKPKPLGGKTYAFFGEFSVWPRYHGTSPAGVAKKLGAKVVDELGDGVDVVVFGDHRGTGRSEAKKKAERSDGLEILDEAAYRERVRIDLTGKRFAFIGGFDCSPSGLEDGMLAKMVATAGGVVTPDVDATLDYLVIGNRRGPSKIAMKNHATKLVEQGAEIAMIDETGFLELVRIDKPNPTGELDLSSFVNQLYGNVDPGKLGRALDMLRKDRFQLYTKLDADRLVGVVRSQSGSGSVYASWLTRDGRYGCSQPSLEDCMGLQGSTCKHLLVLVVGLARTGGMPMADALAWVRSAGTKGPGKDVELASETFIQYKGAEAGEVDWRPTETIPEDFYAL